MAKYRKKPVIVDYDAEQFHVMMWPDRPEGVEKRTADEIVDGETTGRGCEWFVIKTLAGVEVDVADGDWIIRDPNISGFFTICKPDIFEATYEKV